MASELGKQVLLILSEGHKIQREGKKNVPMGKQVIGFVLQTPGANKV